MLNLLFAPNPPRPCYLRSFQSPILFSHHLFLCTRSKPITPAPQTINPTQFPAICYKTDKMRIALLPIKTPFVIRPSTFFRHSSLGIRHSPTHPRFSDINPPLCCSELHP